MHNDISSSPLVKSESNGNFPSGLCMAVNATDHRGMLEEKCHTRYATENHVKLEVGCENTEDGSSDEEQNVKRDEMEGLHDFYSNVSNVNDNCSERKSTAVAENSSIENMVLCNSLIKGIKNQIRDVESKKCMPSEVSFGATNSGDVDNLENVNEVKTENLSVGSLRSVNNGQDVVSDQPLDLRMPMKRSDKFNISNILDKTGRRNKDRHRRKMSKNASNTCKRLSNSLRSLEKFGKEFDFNTTVSQIGFNNVSAAQDNCHDAKSALKYMNDVKSLKIPTLPYTGLINSFHDRLDFDQTFRFSNSKIESEQRAGDYSVNLFKDVKPALETLCKYTAHKCTCDEEFTSLNELSIHAKRSGHKPISRRVSVRDYPKLVRGQDLWLNRGLEQTKRILRCIQCGASFKSLPELTVHMMETQHYEKIVSSDHLKRSHRCCAYCDHNAECVFKCKVCQKHFANMDALSSHMVETGHYKQSAATQKVLEQTMKNPRTKVSDRSPFKVVRKRPFVNESDKEQSIPGKKITSGLKNTQGEHATSIPNSKMSKESCVTDDNESGIENSDGEDLNDRMITCENCLEKIHMSSFVDHVRVCLRIKDNTPVSVKREKNYDFNCADNSFTFDGNSPTSSTFPLGASNQEVNAKESDTECLDMNIIDPRSHPDQKCEGALQAMESLIQNSFGASKSCTRLQLDQNEPETYQSLVQDESDLVTSSNVILESMSKISSRIFDSVYKSQERKRSENDAKPDGNLDFHKRSYVKTENGDCGADGNRCCSDDDSDSLANEVVDRDPRNKYLTEDELEKIDSTAPPKSSALDSLSSFVYGQKLTSEHPLERLEKIKLYGHFNYAKRDAAVNLALDNKPESSSASECSLDRLEKLYGMYKFSADHVGRDASSGAKSSERRADYSAAYSKGRSSSSPRNTAREQFVKNHASAQSTSAANSEKSDNSRFISAANGRIKSEEYISCPVCKVPFLTQNELMLHFMQTRCHDMQTVGDMAMYKSLYHAQESYAFTPFIYLPLDHTAMFTKFNSALK